MIKNFLAGLVTLVAAFAVLSVLGAGFAWLLVDVAGVGLIIEGLWWEYALTGVLGLAVCSGVVYIAAMVITLGDIVAELMREWWRDR